MRKSLPVALLVALAVPAPSLAMPVLGFQQEDAPPRLIDGNAHALTTVGIDGVNLTGPGTVSAPDAAARRQLARAHADHRPAVLLVGNWSEQAGDFSEALAFQTLAGPTEVARAARSLAGHVVSEGWDGVSVDLESLAPRDTRGLSEFVADLRSDLPHAASLTICLQNFTSRGEAAGDGYDLHALAAAVDQVVLMTYDDHGPWESTPGPIGPLAWQRAGIHALEQVVPAGRIFLGAANYGYAWRPHANEDLTVQQARRLVRNAHARAVWDRRAAEWTAHLADGSTLWWSDGRSVARRLRLARELGVHGLAIWSLSTGDPLPAS